MGTGRAGADRGLGEKSGRSETGKHVSVATDAAGCQKRSLPPDDSRGRKAGAFWARLEPRRLARASEPVTMNASNNECGDFLIILPWACNKAPGNPNGEW